MNPDFRGPVLGLDDLLAAKRAAGRAQDLVDVAKLERIATISKKKKIAHRSVRSVSIRR